MTEHTTPTIRESNVLVLGGTGKTGRRVVDRLRARRVGVRVGSRSGNPPFEWNDRHTWSAALDGAEAVYVAFYPDVAVPGAADTVGAFAQQAASAGVGRLVLLSGRGEEEAERTEKVVQDIDVESTILRASWFSQNFSEGAFRDGVQSGAVVLPESDTPEPFVDAEDIADVAVAALVEEGHAGRLYELTGPRLLTFAEAVAELARAMGRPVTYTPVPLDDYAAAMAAEGVPREEIDAIAYLFGTVLDGRNAYVADGVPTALGRPAKDFDDFAWDAARAGVWDEA